jgi:hypothetical protein
MGHADSPLPPAGISRPVPGDGTGMRIDGILLCVRRRRRRWREEMELSRR